MYFTCHQVGNKYFFKISASVFVNVLLMSYFKPKNDNKFAVVGI